MKEWNNTEYVALLAAVVLPLLISFIALLYRPLVFAVGKYGQVPVAIVGLFMIFLVVRRWKGGMGWALSVAGLGFATFFLVWTPHDIWHFSGTPSWYGISAGIWAGFFHGLTVAAALLITYGFYLLYLTARRMRKIEAPERGILPVDYTIIVGIFTLPLLLPLLLRHTTSRHTLLIIDTLSQFISALAYLLSIRFIYKTRHILGNNIGRSLSMIGIGLLFGLIQVIQVSWETALLPDILGPAVLGIPAEWWGTLFTFLLITGSCLIVYGFYLLTAAETSSAPST